MAGSTGGEPEPEAEAATETPSGPMRAASGVAYLIGAVLGSVLFACSLWLVSGVWNAISG